MNNTSGIPYWIPIWFGRCASKKLRFGSLTGITGKWRNFHFYFHKCMGVNE